MEPRELHRYVCSLHGIRDPDLVARAWDEEQARLARLEQAGGFG